MDQRIPDSVIIKIDFPVGLNFVSKISAERGQRINYARELQETDITGNRVFIHSGQLSQFIVADFRTKLFPGSARLVELADRVNTLQVEALCWCGARATHNARTIGGVMVVEGEQVVVGDVAPGAEVAYEVLCRRHHMRQVTARASRAAHTSSLPLPFKE